jgi:hypothetical protein
LRVWKKENQATIPPEYEEIKNALSKGELVEAMPFAFDAWLWATDTFPYVAWQNRFWQTNGFSDVLDFYKKSHKGSLWSEHISSPKSFFNYCKLVIAESGGALAEETYIAEGLTRFFAGTYSALRVSTVMLIISLIIQLLFSFKWLTILIGGAFINSDMIFVQIITSVLFILVLWWMQRLIVKKFRRIRLKEAETIFYAFFLISQKRDK